MLSQDEADQALENLVAEGDRIAANLIDLSGLASEQPPEGVSAERWSATKAQAELLWTHYDAYRGVLQRARAVRSRRDQLEPQELAELSELLGGATVDMPGASGGAERVTLAEAVQRMDASYQEVSAVAGDALGLHVDPAETNRQPPPAAFTPPPGAEPVRPSRAARHGIAPAGEGAQGGDPHSAQPLPRRPDRRGRQNATGPGEPAPTATVFPFPAPGQPGGPSGADRGLGGPPSDPGGGPGGEVEWFHGNAGAARRGGAPVPLGRRQPGRSIGQSAAPASGPEGDGGAQWFQGGPGVSQSPLPPGESPLSRALQRRGTSGPMFPPPDERTAEPAWGEPAQGQPAPGQPAAGEPAWGQPPAWGEPAWAEAGGDADRKSFGGLKAVGGGLRRLQGGFKAARARIEGRGKDESWEPGSAPAADAPLWGPEAGQPNRAQQPPAAPPPPPDPSAVPGGFKAFQPAPPASPSPPPPAPATPAAAPAAREAAPPAGSSGQLGSSQGGGHVGWVELDPPTTHQPAPRRSHAEPSQPPPSPSPPAAASGPSATPSTGASANPAASSERADPAASRPAAPDAQTGQPSGDDRIAAVRTLLTKLEQRSTAQRAVQAEVLAKIASPPLQQVVDLEPLRARVEALEAWQHQAGPTDSQALARELTGVVRDIDTALESTRTAVDNAAGLLERRRELRGRLDAYRAKAKRMGRGEDPLLAECHRRAVDLLRARPCDLRAATKAVAHYQRVLSDDTDAPTPDAAPSKQPATPGQPDRSQHTPSAQRQQPHKEEPS